MSSSIFKDIAEYNKRLERYEREAPVCELEEQVEDIRQLLNGRPDQCVHFWPSTMKVEELEHLRDKYLARIEEMEIAQDNSPEIIYESEWHQRFGSECKEYLGIDLDRLFYYGLAIGEEDFSWHGPYETRTEAEEQLEAAYNCWDERVSKREEAYEAQQIAAFEKERRGDLLRIELARSSAEDLEIDTSVDGEYYDNRPEPLIPKGYLVPGVERVPAEMQAEIDRARTVGQVEHERQARQFAREQEIPYSSPLEDPEQELRQEIKSLDQVIMVHKEERRAELRDDPTIDQARIGDVIRIELAQLRSQRDRLHSERDRIQGRQLTQEHGIER